MSYYGTGDTQTYYHYTDKDSAEKIAESGIIMKSTSAAGDARAGDGVYTTQKDPSNDTFDIAKNNYDDATYFPERKIDDGKLDYVIEIEMDSAKMQDCSDITGRDVHLYRDKDLDLNGDDVKSFAIYYKE